jgi:drug/metabolite transporter (DMT)-like permease
MPIPHSVKLESFFGGNMTTIPRHSGDSVNRHGEMSMRSLGPFLAIAFGLAWGLLALMILFTSQVEAVFGPVSGTNPLFILAVYAPGIAAILLVWWHYGAKAWRASSVGWPCGGCHWVGGLSCLSGYRP